MLPHDFNSLPDPLPAPLSDEIMIDWVDGVISDDEGKQLAAQAGIPQIYDAVIAMRQAAACTARIPEPAGHTTYDHLVQEETNFPPLPAGVSEQFRLAADQAWSQHHKSRGVSSEPSFHFPQQTSQDQTLGGSIDSFASRTSHVAFWRRASTLRFAAAASLTLVVGTAGWLAFFRNSTDGLSSGRNEIAMKTGLEDGGIQAIQATSPFAKIASTSATEQAPSDARLAMSSTEPVTNAADAAAQALDMALASSSGAVDEETTRVLVDPSRAVELARQGRLLIRVGAVSGSTMPHLDSLDSGSSWHVRDDVSQSLVEAVRPYLTAPERAIAASVTNHQDVNTGYGPPDPPEGSNVFAAMRHVMFGPQAPWNQASATYMIDVANSQDALEVVRSATQQGFAANVRFEELPKPVGQMDWNGRLSVPVIVELH